MAGLLLCECGFFFSFPTVLSFVFPLLAERRSARHTPGRASRATDTQTVATREMPVSPPPGRNTRRPRRRPPRTPGAAVPAWHGLPRPPHGVLLTPPARRGAAAAAAGSGCRAAAATGGGGSRSPTLTQWAAAAAGALVPRPPRDRGAAGAAAWPPPPRLAAPSADETRLPTHGGVHTGGCGGPGRRRAAHRFVQRNERLDAGARACAPKTRRRPAPCRPERSAASPTVRNGREPLVAPHSRTGRVAGRAHAWVGEAVGVRDGPRAGASAAAAATGCATTPTASPAQLGAAGGKRHAAAARDPCRRPPRRGAARAATPCQRPRTHPPRRRRCTQ